MIIRILTDVLFFGSVLFLPWWITLFIGILGLIFLENFWEIIVGGLLIDLVYGTPLPHLFSFELWGTVITSILFLLRLFIGDRLFKRQFSV